ncbi:hypothetical protein FJV41_15065 [Myxococcus llanfairpwllgwyngyllgogerychwyrndrobwllllantysiliogogogochensis]|uniref:Lipoprotein n=1 Tax=Myxococcus llanfairpwllgwyngyllgogerychwyrndrobwllllantysiliogogogochensis TaxID=2590453 RepID=A0A540X1P7_9BACT|nr:hypothetical protein [Myxococcus llanfairpwllgwyngyllgogerychwyrndrobwllllantysiliogogogochensis]TQF15133.1 hypothetical protein FJV41_15065 [Myxococcus llanfairpwllgwyngyllgogerychwyrndrobwllllantysiliogogogochensis]
MIRRLLGACVGVAMVLAAGACDSSKGTGSKDGGDDIQSPSDDGGDVGTEDAGDGDAGDGDAGTDAGGDDAGPGDAGPGPGDGGTDPVPDGGTQPTTPEGPWPTDALTNFSAKYDIPKVRSVGVDGAHNVWLLNGNQIGVLRAGTDRPLWTSQPIGQASLGLGWEADKLAIDSTVICGGKAGEAYVGYRTHDEIVGGQRIIGRGEEGFSEERYVEFQKGDVDVVQLNSEGSDIVLREHLYRSAGTSRPSRNEPLGIRNSNDFHYDEDRSIYSCVRVMSGTYEGEVYLGTNHGVTRVRGYDYSSHRHPAWWQTIPNEDPSKPPKQSQRAGYTYGLGLSSEGHLLIANDWKIGILPPNADLKWWDRENRDGVPADAEISEYLLNTFVDPVNPGNDQYRDQAAPQNKWRAIQKTKDGLYYVAGLGSGLWQFQANPQRHDPKKYADTDYVRIEGANTNDYTALAATADGSLFVGTAHNGLWRLTPGKQLEKVAGVSGGEVRQLIYDPRVTPAALYALVDGRLYVLRGY